MNNHDTNITKISYLRRSEIDVLRLIQALSIDLESQSYRWVSLTNEFLAKKTGLTKRTIIRALNNLKEYCFLELRYDKNGSKREMKVRGGHNEN